ncbi:MAG: hypothetical protein ACYCZR_11020 [Burkholderiales bacterium]
MKGLFSLLLFLPLLAMAQQIEVITLKHRQAEDVIPVIQPLLLKGEAVSGTGNQLILRTRNPREIRKVIERIDTAQRTLRITVYQGEDPADESSETYSTESRASYVQVLEGSPAFIRTGKGIQENTAFFGPYGSGVVAQYREVTSGFYALAHLSGDKVVVDVSPVLDKPVDGSVDLGKLSTKVSGKVGKWMELGGIEQNLDSDSIHTEDELKIWIRVDLP